MTSADGLTGLRNALRKDVREWFATPRAVATVLGTLTFCVMATLGPWLGRLRGIRDPGLPLDATASFAGAGWLTILPLAVAFATLSVLVTERDRGTMAWSLSKPLTRDAFILSKVLSATGLVVLLGIATPMLPSVLAATVAYGSVPDAAVIIWTFLGAAALAIFYVGLQFLASVFAWSQALTALVLIGSMFAAQALVALDPRLYDVMPLSIGDWIVAAGRGDVGPVATPLAYAAWVLVPLAAVRARFARIEL